MPASLDYFVHVQIDGENLGHVAFHRNKSGLWDVSHPLSEAVQQWLDKQPEFFEACDRLTARIRELAGDG